MPRPHAAGPQQRRDAEAARWVTVAAVIAVESLAGIMYMFGVYSPLLKTTYALSQAELDGLATATNIANNVGIWLGSAIDRWGPRPVMATGGVLGGCCWLALWAALTYQWELAYGQLMVIVIGQGHWADAGDKACIYLMASSFPESRGTAIGLSKALVGLSAALVAAGYSIAWSPDIVGFMLVIGVAFAVLWTLCGWIVRVIPTSGVQQDRKRLREWQLRRFSSMSRGLAGIALLLLADALEPQLQRLGNTLGLIGLAALVAFAAFPSEEGLAEATGAGDAGAESEAESDDEEGSRLLPAGSEASAKLVVAAADGCGVTQERTPRPPSEDRRLTQRWWKDTDFWLVSTILFINFGCGLELVNNLGQITPALAMVTGSRPAAAAVAVVDATENVSIFSVCSCLGRIFTGVASDYLLRVHNMPRTFFFLFGSVAMGASMLLLAVGTPFFLRGATIGAGFAFGSVNTQCPLMVADLFGMEHFAENHALVAMSAATLSSYVFATLLFAMFYDRTAAVQAQTAAAFTLELELEPGEGAGVILNDCSGVQCVREAALWSAVCCAVAVVLSLVLVRRHTTHRTMEYGR